MQFQYNSDHPGLSSDGQHIAAEARNPTEFPPAQPVPCARITTRVYHPSRNQVATVQNVLVRTMAHPQQQQQMLRQQQRRQSAEAMMSESFSRTSSSDDLSSISDHSMAMDDDLGGGPGDVAAQIAVGVTGPLHRQEEDRAYWVQRTIREAIYGRVLFAIVLKRRTPSLSPNDSADWEVTDKHCAVKEMSWQHIRRERDRLAEDPIKEVAAMQHLRQWHMNIRQAQQLEKNNNNNNNSNNGDMLLIDGVAESFRAIMETNIMMPLDLLTDDRNMYSIMPYCDGGELFERLDLNERFTEEEARYWMHQVLNGLENMQKAGICHRDISLENLLVHETGALIIDMGMCLRIPFDGDDDEQQQPQPQQLLLNLAAAGLTASMRNMSMNGGIDPPVESPQSPPPTASPVLKENVGGGINSASLDARAKRRHLIRPQGTCGKWNYMSPEVYKNQEPFDGYAVDMWAAGVILFLMVTGFPPWERAGQTDERFKYMSAGYLVQMLTEWNLGISGDAMDLLQRMLFLDPKDRLSLDQVRAHPWMANGTMATPPRISGGMF